jgi:Protein of unknown function (DUF1573)/Beta-propeller repeat
VTGTTYSTDFPTTPGSFQPLGDSGKFISKLNPTLSKLVYSSYFGEEGFGEREGSTTGLAVDSHGNAFVTGYTFGGDIQLVNPVSSKTGSGDEFGNTVVAFLSVFNPSGSKLAFSTLLSGSFSSDGRAVALDRAGDVYLTGRTSDTDFPTTKGAFERTPPAQTDPDFTPQHIFVTKFSMKEANPAICFSPGWGLEFGVVAKGASPVLPMTATNCGTRPLTIFSAISSTSNFAATVGKCNSVAPGKSCIINVRYTPSLDSNNDNATLKITSNAPIPSQTAVLAGEPAF